MLLPFSFRVAEWPPVWERAVNSVNSTYLVWALVKFGIEGGMWDVIVLVPDHCLSIYFLSIVVCVSLFLLGLRVGCAIGLYLYLIIVCRFTFLSLTRP